MFTFSHRSLNSLTGLHPDLIKVVERALEISPVDFTVVEGLRSKQRQKDLFDAGKSKTLNSRHLTGHAVDLVALDKGKMTWVWRPYEQIADAMKAAAEESDIDIEWGGDWASFKDGPHFQLSWGSHPIAPQVFTKPTLSWWERLLNFIKRKKL